MKKIAIFLSFLLFDASVLFAQSSKDYAIYDTIMSMSGTGIYNKPAPVPTTSLRTLKNFNFEDQKEYDFNSKDTLNNDWKAFLRSIKITALQTEHLDTLFLKKYPLFSKSTRGIVLSPIIISSDGAKAICGAYLSGAGDIMYLFEKKTGKWTLRRRYVMAVE